MDDKQEITGEVKVPQERNIPERVRNYACIVYPESAPENWLQILADMAVPCLVSPLHNRDFNADGKPKKPHYHVLFTFEGKKSKSQFNVLIKPLNGTEVVDVQSIRGYARYLCHLDNPEKAQYNVADIKQFGGADYEAFVCMSSDITKQVRLMQYYIKKQHIYSYNYFLDICAESFPDWHYLLVNRCSFVIQCYLQSRNEDRKENMYGIRKETK